ncbi:hypothetical protein K2P97_06750 [bacterium]|nr:hypothetical protein [bacterium]
MKLILFILLFTSSVLAQNSNIEFSKERWVEISFGKKINPNTVEYSPNYLKINVDSSASPLVYKFDKVIEVNSFSVDLEVTGLMTDAADKSKFEDDSYFRLGFVVIGENYLGNVGKLFAPDWVLKLFSLAPEGAGLDKIYFFNLAKNSELIGKERLHPSSKYIFEKIIAAKNGDSLNFKSTLEKPLKTAALWLSIDGDNTKSKFSVKIKNIGIGSK